MAITIIIYEYVSSFMERMDLFISVFSCSLRGWSVQFSSGF
jgi:hypothetical protein